MQDKKAKSLQTTVLCLIYPFFFDDTLPDILDAYSRIRGRICS